MCPFFDVVNLDHMSRYNFIKFTIIFSVRMPSLLMNEKNIMNFEYLNARWLCMKSFRWI